MFCYNQCYNHFPFICAVIDDIHHFKIAVIKLADAFRWSTMQKHKLVKQNSFNLLFRASNYINVLVHIITFTLNKKKLYKFYKINICKASFMNIFNTNKTIAVAVAATMI